MKQVYSPKILRCINGTPSSQTFLLPRVPITSSGLIHDSLADKGELTLRIYAMVDCPPLNGFCRHEVPRLDHYGRGFLSVRSVKLFVDGALGSWGAAMIDDYDDKSGWKGNMLLSYDRLEELIRLVLPSPTTPYFPAFPTHKTFYLIPLQTRPGRGEYEVDDSGTTRASK